MNVLVFTVTVVTKEDLRERVVNIANEIQSNLESLDYVASATVTFGEQQPQQEDR